MELQKCALFFNWAWSWIFTIDGFVDSFSFRDDSREFLNSCFNQLSYLYSDVREVADSQSAHSERLLVWPQRDCWFMFKE
jgi:hypothetical protein